MTEQPKEKKPRVKLTGLWMNTGADGKSYLSGTLGGARVVIYENGFKRSEKEPSHNLYIEQATPKTSTGAAFSGKRMSDDVNREDDVFI